MMKRLFAILGLGVWVLTVSACGTTSKPCTHGGDLTQLPAIKGNRECYQKKRPDGSYVNDGRFIQWHPDGSMAIDGEFKDGRKHGTWIHYDEKGQKTAEKYYNEGVETSVRPPGNP